MSGENAMAEEQAIQAELVAKFPFLAARMRIARERRMFAETPAEQPPRSWATFRTGCSSRFSAR